MDLTLSAEQLDIVSLTSRTVQRLVPTTRLHQPDADRLDPALRRLLAEQGWFGIALDAELGGSGLTVVEEMLLFRELGRGLAPTVCLPITLAAKIAVQAGKSELAARLLSGSESIGLAVALERARSDKQTVSGDARVLDYRDASYMVWADAAEALLIDLTRAEVHPRPCLDKSVSMALIELGDAPVVAHTADSLIRRTGQLLTAAMLLGIAEATRDMIVAYAKERRTFGRPIGAYQAVRHPCADMAVRCEVARCQLFLAAVCVRDDRGDVDLQLDSAKLLANAAALNNVDWNIQLHGGIGVTDEHDAHLYMKRARLLCRCFGSDPALLDRIIDAQITV